MEPVGRAETGVWPSAEIKEKMPRILWLRSDGRSEEANHLENATGLKVAVSTGAPSTWEEIQQDVQVILIELPHESEGGTSRLWIKRSDTIIHKESVSA